MCSDRFFPYLASLSHPSQLARGGGQPLPSLSYPRKRDYRPRIGTSGAEDGKRKVRKRQPSPCSCFPPPEMVPTPELIYFLLKKIMTNEKQALYCLHGNPAILATYTGSVRSEWRVRRGSSTQPCVGDRKSPGGENLGPERLMCEGPNYLRSEARVPGAKILASHSPCRLVIGH